MEVKISDLKPFVGSLNRLIVEPFKIEEKRASRFIDTSKIGEKPGTGTVVSVSDKDQNGNLPTLKIGDTIMFGAKGHTELPLKGKTYLVMTENDVYAQIVSNGL